MYMRINDLTNFKSNDLIVLYIDQHFLNTGSIIKASRPLADELDKYKCLKFYQIVA